MADDPATPIIEDESPMETDDADGHGRTVLGKQASCGIQTDGVVDCLKCIEESRPRLNSWSESDRQIAETAVELVDGRGKWGMMIEELRVRSFKVLRAMETDTLFDRAMWIAQALPSLASSMACIPSEYPFFT